MSVIFKSSMEEVHRCTLSIRMHSEMVCEICKAEGQFLPHGWLYKMNADGLLCKVGKRIICDRRRGGKGCGATVRVLVRSETYRLHFVTASLMLFISALTAGLSVMASYEKATRSAMSRNAWRWWQKLIHRMPDIRGALFKNFPIPPSGVTEKPAPIKSAESSSVITAAHRRRKTLIAHREVLLRWITKAHDSDVCALFQEKQQIALL